MHCPRCGSPNEPGDRFCASCGAALVKAEPKPQRPWRERLGRTIGTDRRTRLLTAATALALLVAVVAFFSLDEDDEETIPRDAYTVAADRMCVAAKRQIVAVQRQGLKAETADLATGARDLLPVVAEWRSNFDALQVPSDRLEQARDLDAALQEVEREIGALARVAADSKREEILTQAEEADEASTAVEEAVAELGLSQCSRLTIGLTQN